MLLRGLVTPRTQFIRLLCVVVVATCALAAVATPSGADVSFINAKRLGAGLPAVGSHSGLAAVASRHSSEMSTAGRLAHSSNLPSSVSSVLSGWQAIGENVGVGGSVAEVNAMFMQSATHRANIVGDYTLAGVGTATGPDGRVWVTQVFARVGSTKAPDQATTTGESAPVPVPSRSTAPRVSRSAPRPAPAAVPPTQTRRPEAVDGLSSLQGGYRVVAEDGGVFAFGDAVFAGSAADLEGAGDIVGGASSPSGNGYILFDGGGRVFAFGDADFAGNASELDLSAPVVAGAMSPDGDGYSLFAADGGVLTFGEARFAGSLVGQSLNGRIVGGAATPTGRGYWLAGADGGVYAFGDAKFQGSRVELGLPGASIRSITATPSGQGYWLLSTDGGVFAFGDAGFFGSAADSPAGNGFTAFVPAVGGKGYWLVRSDREVVPFGDVDGRPRHFYGSASFRIV